MYDKPKTKHTLGPWFPVYNSYYWDICIGNKENSASIGKGCHVCDEVNANLIAATPELLKALEEAPEILSGEFFSSFRKRYADWYRGQRRQAIGTARGDNGFNHNKAKT